MGPFQDKKVWDRLAGGGSTQPFQVSVLTTLVAASSAASPFTGMRAGIVHVELVERTPDSDDPHEKNPSVTDHYDSLGAVVLGDVATLRDEDGAEITLMVRRARIQPAPSRGGGTPITRMPPEVVPLLQRAKGRGVVCYRELTLSTGDKLRLRAVIEPTRSVVADGYRSGTRISYVVRDDLGPVVLEEVFDVPAW
jgi:2-phospho-L-lactate guanylyltransferase (CobY/MobA/RfbA family)